MFQTVNDVVESFFLEEASDIKKFIVNWLHMVFWFCSLQVVLAFVTGAIGPEPANLQESEFKVKCYATLLAHVTGFASINAWGSLQQMDFFAQSYAMSFCVLPISFVGQFALQRVTDHLRLKVAMLGDGEESVYEKQWDFEVEEAENDIMGLTLSFNLTQAIRFMNSDYLPDQEGVEPMEVVSNHTAAQIWHLAAVALMFAVFLGAMHFSGAAGHGEEHGHGHGEEGEESEEEASPHGHEPEYAAHSEAMALGKKNFDSAEKSEMLAGIWIQIKERAWEVTLLAWSMGIAWCCFYSGKMFLAQSPVFQDAMQLSIGLALFLSLIAFSCIRGLDMIADRSTSQNLINALKQIINSLGLLVGFAWEQCFDQSVQSIASRTVWKLTAKFFLALFCVIVVVPAWYLYILPMAITQNWEWGFLVKDLEDPEEKARWQKVIKYIQKKKPGWWKNIELETARKVTAKQIKKQAYLQDNHEDYHSLPGGEVQALKVRVQHLITAMYVKTKELEQKEEQNATLSAALTMKNQEMEERDQVERIRAADLQSDIQHMDTMLLTMREVEGTLASCGAPQNGSRAAKKKTNAMV